MSKGRPGFKKRELHPEVEAILCGDGNRPEESEWHSTLTILGRAMHPVLAFMVMAIYYRKLASEMFRLGGLKAFSGSLPPKDYEELIKGADEEGAQIWEGMKNDVELEEERLTGAFLAALYHGDGIFLGDVAFLRERFREEDSMNLRLSEQARWRLFEHGTYKRAFDSVKRRNGTASITEVVLELEGCLVAADYETVRNRLTQYGLIPSRAGK